MAFIDRFLDETGQYDRRVVFASGFLFGFTGLAFILMIWRMQTPFLVCV